MIIQNVKVCTSLVTTSSTHNK